MRAHRKSPEAVLAPHAVPGVPAHVPHVPDVPHVPHMCRTCRTFSLCHRDRFCLLHIEICCFQIGKWCKIMKSGMNGVQVPRFRLILREDGATASRNPLECLPAPKTAKKYKQIAKMTPGPWGPWGPHGGQW